MECYRKKLPVELEMSENVSNENQEKYARFQKVYAGMPSPYKTRKALRIVVLSLLIAGIAAAILAQHGVFHLTPAQFVQGLNHMLHQLNWVRVGVGVAVFCVLMAGAILVIKRVINKTDPRTGARIGKLSGDSHWVPMVRADSEGARKDGNGYINGYVDISTVKEGEQGRAYVYRTKTALEHYSIAIAVAATTPLHAALVIVYNAVRLVVLPIILTVAMIIEKVRGKPFREGHPITFKHIGLQMGLSLWEIFKAPFYALAMTFAALYALVDPLNGRKLGAYIEKDWNNDVDVVQGFVLLGMCGGVCTARVQFEGAKFSYNNDDKKTTMVSGFFPNLFQPPALYVPMCWQWRFIMDVNEKGKMTKINNWMSEIDRSEFSQEFYTLETLKAEVVLLTQNEN